MLSKIVVLLASFAGLASLACHAQVDARQSVSKDESSPKHLLVRVRMLELNQTKMRRLGIDFAQANDAKEPQKAGQVTIGSDIPPSFVKALEKQNIANELDSANIVLKADGKPAEFFQGGEIEVPVGNGQSTTTRFGTELQATAKAINESQVSLNVQCKLSEIDHSRSVTVLGKKIPGFRVRQCSTALESELGKTVAISGPSYLSRPQREECSMIILVTCEDASELLDSNPN